MRTRPAFALLFPLAVALGGCATSGPRFHEVQASMPALPADQGRIVLYRSTSFGAVIQPSIKLNGTVVGGSTPYGFYFVDRPAGDYTVSATTESEQKVSFTLSAGEERFVRLQPAFGFVVGRMVPVLVDRNEALSEIKDLRLVEPKVQ